MSTEENFRFPIWKYLMNQVELKLRTKQFGLQLIELVDRLPNTISGRAIANQLIRSAMSVGANYRAACRGRSKAEFIAKLGVVREEPDESGYWLEVIGDSRMLKDETVTALQDEANELTAIFTATLKTAQSRQ